MRQKPRREMVSDKIEESHYGRPPVENPTIDIMCYVILPLYSAQRTREYKSRFPMAKSSRRNYLPV